MLGMLHSKGAIDPLREPTSDLGKVTARVHHVRVDVSSIALWIPPSRYRRQVGAAHELLAYLIYTMICFRQHSSRGTQRREAIPW